MHKDPIHVGSVDPIPGVTCTPSRELKCGICQDGWSWNPAISQGPKNPIWMEGVQDDRLYEGYMDKYRRQVDAERGTSPCSLSPELRSETSRCRAFRIAQLQWGNPVDVQPRQSLSTRKEAERSSPNYPATHRFFLPHRDLEKSAAASEHWWRSGSGEDEHHPDGLIGLAHLVEDNPIN